MDAYKHAETERSARPLLPPLAPGQRLRPRGSPRAGGALAAGTSAPAAHRRPRPAAGHAALRQQRRGRGPRARLPQPPPSRKGARPQGEALRPAARQQGPSGHGRREGRAGAAAAVSVPSRAAAALTSCPSPRCRPWEAPPRAPWQRRRPPPAAAAPGCAAGASRSPGAAVRGRRPRRPAAAGKCSSALRPPAAGRGRPRARRPLPAAAGAPRARLTVGDDPALPARRSVLASARCSIAFSRLAEEMAFRILMAGVQSPASCLKLLLGRIRSKGDLKGDLREVGRAVFFTKEHVVTVQV